MNNANLKTEQNIQALGLSYIYNYLDREGYIICEVNTDTNHHYQILAKRADKSILVAVRTAYHPDVGTINVAKKEQLIEASDRYNAIPHFAGLTVTPLETEFTEIDRRSGGRKYEINFNGITVV